jgi:hypothetical protein
MADMAADDLPNIWAASRVERGRRCKIARN